MRPINEGYYKVATGENKGNMNINRENRGNRNNQGKTIKERENSQ